MWNVFRVEWEIIVKQSASTVAKNTDDYRSEDSADGHILLVDKSSAKGFRTDVATV